jgi:hypothetical protein
MFYGVQLLGATIQPSFMALFRLREPACPWLTGLPPNCRFPAANVFDGPDFDICGSKRHHNVNMTEKHLGFALLRSPFGNREPRTIGTSLRPCLRTEGL